ncbi:sorting nexin-11 isoform X2 [Sebastes fasciatus]
MISNQEEDEFVAVRVQDPRMQNEGHWNSYVDYKIFLHTNSKAFTAKTSCVRRRYSEFAWLKKKLQKNSGLVPVPDLPGKSFFSFSNEDFLERRRKGLQVFLDNVVNMTVCLSDSQLHLFLQTQLPVGHIQDCVQGHTPYSVTDAILTYASSNRGFAQAQEDDPIKEPSLTVSYESMESPAPHQPFLQPKEIFNPELLTGCDSDPPEELCDKDTVEFQHKEKSSVKVLQKDNHLEAVVEDCGPTGVTFFLGDGQDIPESLSLGEETQQRSCQIQTPVEVHSPMGTGFEENRVDSLFEEECSVREESVKTLDTEEEAAAPQADQLESSGEAEMVKCVDSAVILDFKDSDHKEQGTESDTGSQEGVLEVVCSEEQVLENVISEVNALEHVDITEVHMEDVSCPEEFEVTEGQKEAEAEKEKVDFEPEICVSSAAILDFKVSDFKEQGTESDAGSQEDVLEVVCSEEQVLENHIISEVNALGHVDSTEVHAEDVSCSEEFHGQIEPEKSDESEVKDETTLQSEIHEETHNVLSVPEVESRGGDDDIARQMDQVEQEVDLVGTIDDSDEDSHSSSNESIVKVSDEESETETEDSIPAANGYIKTSPEEVALWPQVEASTINISDLHMNACPVEKEDISALEDEDLHYITDISKSLDLNSTENSDFSIIESSCTPGLADSKCTEQETLSSLSLDASEETHEVEVH